MVLGFLKCSGGHRAEKTQYLNLTLEIYSSGVLEVLILPVFQIKIVLGVFILLADVTIGEAIKLRPVADGVFVESSPGVRAGDLVACMRVRIHGISRIKNLKKFAVVTRVRVQAADSAAYRISVPKVEVCVHR